MCSHCLFFNGLEIYQICHLLSWNLDSYLYSKKINFVYSNTRTASYYFIGDDIMIFKLVRTFQIYWLKVFMIFCVSTKFQCVVLQKIEFKVYIENYTYNQIKLSTHHYLRFTETEYRLDVRPIHVNNCL